MKEIIGYLFLLYSLLTYINNEHRYSEAKQLQPHKTPSDEAFTQHLVGLGKLLVSLIIGLFLLVEGYR